MKKVNKLLVTISDIILWFHVFWVVYVIVGFFYKYPGFLWTLHFWMGFLLIVGVILNQCPLSTIERWIRKKSGQNFIPNYRESRFLEIVHNITGVRLPNAISRILGFVYFVITIIVHLLR